MVKMKCRPPYTIKEKLENIELEYQICPPWIYRKVKECKYRSNDYYEVMNGKLKIRFYYCSYKNERGNTRNKK